MPKLALVTDRAYKSGMGIGSPAWFSFAASVGVILASWAATYFGLLEYGTALQGIEVHAPDAAHIPEGEDLELSEAILARPVTEIMPPPFGRPLVDHGHWHRDWDYTNYGSFTHRGVAAFL